MNTEDRELLELAAKAAGDVSFDGFTFIQRSRYSANVWEPLHDDGDALRLMVCLGLQVGMDIGVINVTMVSNGNGAVSVTQEHMDEPVAATRRAIVRAAAEIGKVKP